MGANAFSPEQSLARASAVRGALQNLKMESPAGRAAGTPAMRSFAAPGPSPELTFRLSQTPPTAGNDRIKSMILSEGSPFYQSDYKRVAETAEKIDKELDRLTGMGPSRGGLHPQEADFYRRVIAERRREALFTFGEPSFR